jgi:large subunit ribosomal protein L32
MAVPKKKVSKTRKHRRHSEWQRRKLRKITNRLNLVKCPNCGKYKLAHRVCPHCGYYKGQQVLTIKTKTKEEQIEA